MTYTLRQQECNGDNEAGLGGGVMMETGVTG